MDPKITQWGYCPACERNAPHFRGGLQFLRSIPLIGRILAYLGLLLVRCHRIANWRCESCGESAVFLRFTSSDADNYVPCSLSDHELDGSSFPLHLKSDCELSGPSGSLRLIRDDEPGVAVENPPVDSERLDLKLPSIQVKSVIETALEDLPSAEPKTYKRRNSNVPDQPKVDKQIDLDLPVIKTRTILEDTFGETKPRNYGGQFDDPTGDPNADSNHARLDREAQVDRYLSKLAGDEATEGLDITDEEVLVWVAKRFRLVEGQLEEMKQLLDQQSTATRRTKPSIPPIGQLDSSAFVALTKYLNREK